MTQTGAQPRRVAIFDFDHTLIVGDSLWPFLHFTAGRPAALLALGAALAQFAWARLRGLEMADGRSFVKDILLRRLLAGRSLDQLGPALARTRAWQRDNPPLMRALREHASAGDAIVIASGGLDLYLPELLRGLPHDALLCTEVGVADGIITGTMTRGNCVRARKAERVAQWLAANGPFADSFGYGNYPHDLPMLALVKHRIIVS